VELHGFLSYLVKVTLSGGRYSVFGYKGKQVRDNIHSHDVVRAIEELQRKSAARRGIQPGGGRANSISMLEAIERIEQMTAAKLDGTTWTKRARATTFAYISNLENSRATIRIGQLRATWTRSSKRSLRRNERSWRRPRRDEHGDDSSHREGDREPNL